MNERNIIALNLIHAAVLDLDAQDACIILTHVLCGIVKRMGEDREFLVDNAGRQFDILEKWKRQ